jgi:hypothetical protein
MRDDGIVYINESPIRVFGCHPGEAVWKSLPFPRVQNQRSPSQKEAPALAATGSPNLSRRNAPRKRLMKRLGRGGGVSALMRPAETPPETQPTSSTDRSLTASRTGPPERAQARRKREVEVDPRRCNRKASPRFRPKTRRKPLPSERKSDRPPTIAGTKLPKPDRAGADRGSSVTTP